MNFLMKLRKNYINTTPTYTDRRKLLKIKKFTYYHDMTAAILISYCFMKDCTRHGLQVQAPSVVYLWWFSIYKLRSAGSEMNYTSVGQILKCHTFYGRLFVFWRNMSSYGWQIYYRGIDWFQKTINLKHEQEEN